MKNMDKGLTVPKWVLTVLPKIPQMHPTEMSAQAQWFRIFEKKTFFGCPKSVYLDNLSSTEVNTR